MGLGEMVVDEHLLAAPSIYVPGHVTLHYGLSRRELRGIDPEDLRAAVGFLVHGALLDPADVGDWLRGRCGGLGGACPLALLRDDSLLRVIDSAQALGRRMEGL